MNVYSDKLINHNNQRRTKKKSYNLNNDSNEFSKSLIKKHVRVLQDSIKTNN